MSPLTLHKKVAKNLLSVNETAAGKRLEKTGNWNGVIDDVEHFVDIYIF